MSYFECEHGKKYFPFGRGGKEKVLRSLDLVTVNAEGIEDNAWRDNIQNCPFHSFPISENLAVNHDGDDSIEFPVVLRSPKSDISKIYDALCDDVIGEIFKIRTGALVVITYVLRLNSTTSNPVFVSRLRGLVTLNIEE